MTQLAWTRTSAQTGVAIAALILLSACSLLTSNLSQTDLQQCDAHLLANHPSAALPFCDRAVNSTHSASAYNDRATAKAILGDYAGAMDDITMALQRNATLTAAYIERGIIKFSTGDYNGSLADYDAAARIDSSDARIYAHRAATWQTLNHSAEAIRDLDQAITFKPDYATAYAYRCYSKSHMHDYYGAIDDCTAAIKLDSTIVEAYDNRATAEAHLGRLQDALTDMDASLQLRPLARAYFQRAQIEQLLGQNENVQADISKARELDKTLPDYDTLIKMQSGQLNSSS
jgi:tetratricopeptide (TPR) repeat protein